MHISTICTRIRLGSKGYIAHNSNSKHWVALLRHHLIRLWVINIIIVAVVAALFLELVLQLIISLYFMNVSAWLVATPVASIAAVVALLVTFIVVSTTLGWTIVSVEASRPLPLALPTCTSKVILVVTILTSFPTVCTLSLFTLGTTVATWSICWPRMRSVTSWASTTVCPMVGTSSMLALVCSDLFTMSTWVLRFCSLFVDNFTVSNLWTTLLTCLKACYLKQHFKVPLGTFGY